MTVGVVILAHQDLVRVAEVARYWDQNGVPVVIHVDRRVRASEFNTLTEAVGGCSGVSFAPRIRCHWGGWSIVRASRVAAEAMLRRHGDVGHVLLTSGSCLPVKHAQTLRAFLRQHPETDFIESVTQGLARWSGGGFEADRFQRWFPISWKTWKWGFDLLVRLQQKFGIERRAPEDLRLHLGSQWWCLTRSTLQAILDDPESSRYDRFFRWSWIPDESYFQTLVRKHGRLIESRSLTAAHFDSQGRPHILYDDHLDDLRQSECFVARKIWPGADGLYGAFLNAPPHSQQSADPLALSRRFAAANLRRTRGRPGLYNAGRFPNSGWENGRSAAPYAVVEGLAPLFEDFDRWLAGQVRAEVHGHLFAPGGAEFSSGGEFGPGGLSADPRLRDYNPAAFLTNLVWSGRERRQVFRFGPEDTQDITGFLTGDPNAHVVAVTGGWIVPYLSSQAPTLDEITRIAALIRREDTHVQALLSPETRAHVTVVDLATFLDAPARLLGAVMSAAGAGEARGPIAAPKLRDLSALPAYLGTLRDAGLSLRAFGLVGARARSASQLASRPEPA